MSLQYYIGRVWARVLEGYFIVQNSVTLMLYFYFFCTDITVLNKLLFNLKLWFTHFVHCNYMHFEMYMLQWLSVFLSVCPLTCILKLCWIETSGGSIFTESAHRIIQSISCNVHVCVCVSVWMPPPLTLEDVQGLNGKRLCRLT